MSRSNVSAGTATACPKSPGAEANSVAPNATPAPADSWWPESVESKLWVKFGRPHDFFMTLPEESAALRGHLVRRGEEPILLHPRLEQYVCEWQPGDDVALRLSIDPIGCLYIHPVRQRKLTDGPFDGDYAKVVELSETRWVEFAQTSDPYVLYGAEPVRRLPRPKWPAESFETLLKMAMPNRIISDLAHPIQRFMKPPKAKWGARGFKGICR